RLCWPDRISGLLHRWRCLRQTQTFARGVPRHGTSAGTTPNLGAVAILMKTYTKWLAGLLLTGSLHAAEFDRSLPDCGIQKAIDALGAQGGEVVLPAGRFELLRALLLPSNISLRGQG